MSEDTATDVLGEEARRTIETILAEHGMDGGPVQHDNAVRALAALVARAHAAGAAEERERIKGLLQRAADGRTEYASSGGPDHQVATLRDEAQAFTNAARLCDDPSVILGLVPSWRWTEDEDRIARGSS